MMSTCPVCHKEYKARKGKKFCSTTCRVKAHFAKSTEKDFLAGLSGLTPDEIQEYIAGIGKDTPRQRELQKKVSPGGLSGYTGPGQRK